MAEDALLESHREWIGYVQPVGLLVAPAALATHGVFPDKNIAPLQLQLRQLVESDEANAPPAIEEFAGFAAAFLGWRRSDLAGDSEGPALPDTLAAHLVEYGETLRPTYAVPASAVTSEANPWQMLVRVEPDEIALDVDVEDDGRRWVATPHARFERLLRETGIPAGLLTNGNAFRLIYAPKGETSGFATFDLAAMTEVTGRPMLAAFHMLLQVNRLFGLSDQSLPKLLAESRLYQEKVSEQLAEQVLAALHELLRGLTAADTRIGRTRIVDLARTDPDHLYSGLLTALMRLVFILYAEDRGLFPRDPVWVQHYSLAGLYDRLRDEAALYPDTMDDRLGAWAQLVALWRLIHAGGKHGGMRLTARRGRLFDPDRFPFFEGRAAATDAPEVPPVSDGVIWRILNRLLVLDGERLSYRTLDVEQIGSVYQAVMGFTIELTSGRSLAIKAPKRGGAAATVNLEELLATPLVKRSEWLRQRTDRKLTAKQTGPLKEAKTTEAIETALDSVIDRAATPTILSAGVPVLQPTEARRKTGSHYTPRTLTAPIVTEALRPVLERLGSNPTPDQILDLKVLDPAVGSGAFLVEACRQLSDALVKSWVDHGGPPKLPPDEDALLHARRLIAQRCLYGVDRNAMAADLAKLSLWLATLAQEHEFTFLDHAIRHGDALVGLFRDEIARLNWSEGGNVPFAAMLVEERIKKAQGERKRIREAVEGVGEHELRPLLNRSDQHLADVNLIGDAVVSAFFSAGKSKAREKERQRVVAGIELGGAGWQQRLQVSETAIRAGAKSLYPFHWELQFPEVFLRKNPGFDVIVGNPPFAGKNSIINNNADYYLDWLQTIHEGAHGNSDLVAHFFRRAFRLLRVAGCFGLIATNTVRQGDTRGTGLRWIRQHGGTIYSAKRRHKWPGEAAVIVSVIHIAKGPYAGSVLLDGRSVDKITAYLFDQGGDDNPQLLAANVDRSFIGAYVLGMGFTFDDRDTKGVASPVSIMQDLISKDRRNAERIFPYIGGEEINSHPIHACSRYVINFENFPLRRDSSLPLWARSSEKVRRDMLRSGVVPSDYSNAVAADWPELLRVLEEKARPERARKKDKTAQAYWWRFLRPRPELKNAIRDLHRVVIRSRIGNAFAFTMLPTGIIFNEKTVVFASESYAFFSCLQSRIHEVWAVFFSSTLKDDLQYTPSDCFESFPFPTGWENDEALDGIGRSYFEYRATLMIGNNEGMTETYNRFHDPNEKATEIVKLRELQDAMDAAVVCAYGWTDIETKPVFEPEWTDEDGDAPMRYRWPEAVRDDVLARLLDLNAERAREEARLGLTAKSGKEVNDDMEDFELEVTDA